jgi:hypothetical protein
MTALRGWTLAVLLVAASPRPVPAQVFVAARPHPQFQIGPLFIRAAVTPTINPVTLDVLFSLAFPPDKTIAGMEQDLYLLWPGALRSDASVGPPDPALAKYVEARGFSVVGEGRATVRATALYATGATRPVEVLPGGAPFVTFVRLGGALGLTASATWIHIPWNYRMANRTWLIDLKFVDPNFVHPKPANWLETTFWGQRYRVALSFDAVRERGMFPM